MIGMVGSARVAAAAARADAGWWVEELKANQDELREQIQVGFWVGGWVGGIVDGWVGYVQRQSGRCGGWVGDQAGVWNMEVADRLGGLPVGWLGGAPHPPPSHLCLCVCYLQ